MPHSFVASLVYNEEISSGMRSGVRTESAGHGGQDLNVLERERKSGFKISGHYPAILSYCTDVFCEQTVCKRHAVSSNLEHLARPLAVPGEIGCL